MNSYMPLWIKKHRSKIVILLVTSVLFNVATLFLPPNFRGLSFYSLLFIFDLLMLTLFFSVFKWTNRQRTIFQVIYWLPFILLSTIVLCAIFIPFPNWATIIKIYVATLFAALFFSHFLFYFFIVIIKLIWWLSKNDKISKILFITGLSFSIMIFLICIIAPFYWTVYPQVVPVEISSKQVPKAFDNYRIVQISDLHCDYFRNEKPFQRMADRINRIKPDLLLITGDIVTYKAAELKRFCSVLQNIKVSDGIYCVMGNHDYGSYYNQWKSMDEVYKNQAELIHYFEQIGWKLLRNEACYIEKGVDTMVVAGTENQCLRETYYPCKGDITLALQGISEKYPVVLMTHDPVYWEKELSHDDRPIFLTLSGHLHGMQMGYFFKAFQWNILAIFKKYWGGLYEEEGHFLYINSGFGTVGFPFRIGLKPEITVLTLKSEVNL